MILLICALYMADAIYLFILIYISFISVAMNELPSNMLREMVADVRRATGVSYSYSQQVRYNKIFV